MIRINSLCKSYEQKKIIDNLSINLEENVTYCIMGISGIGKTTLLNMISGIDKPDSGRIEGLEKAEKSFIFQENRLIPWLSAYDNLFYVTKNTDRIHQALEFTELNGDENKLPDELSGGMKRRLAIARAYAYGGDTFFIDEPLYGLDIKTSEGILRLIKDMTNKKTSFIITHSAEEAFFLSDKIIFINTSPVTKCDILNKNDFTSANDLKKYILDT